MSNLTINTDQIPSLVQDAGKLVFKREAEEALLTLLHLRDQLDEKIDEVKTQIAQAGESIDQNFKGVIGEHVKAIYRVYGEKYTFDPQEKDVLIAKNLLVTKPVHKVDSEKVDEIIKKTNTLPEGIIQKNRSKIISLSYTKDEKVPTELLPSVGVDAREE